MKSEKLTDHAFVYLVRNHATSLTIYKAAVTNDINFGFLTIKIQENQIRLALLMKGVERNSVKAIRVRLSFSCQKHMSYVVA